ncbi:sulfocyanin-like copper-binding protein [Metallosphaera sedula]|uniref:sulfocyanin-like copper-binding protein n=1 Tax=Metallosphaera sedula TaxID=43687 RepID=UPI0020BF6F35|nr:sulfocyanin-like copper-binding protein [Metallosphaera sedula]BBL46845.1 sulfocyanin [Metallosphaera sedula]
MKAWQIGLVIIVVALIGISLFVISRHTTQPLTPGNMSVKVSNTSVTNTTKMENTTNIINNTSTKQITNTTNETKQVLPPGAVKLNYDAQNHTVFIYLYASPTAPNFLNYNGTTNGEMKIYIPANWSILFTFYNPEPTGHALAVVQNNTPIPNQLVLSQDGKVIFEIGYNNGNGISGGTSVSGLLKDLSPGYYWIACPIPGHAENGMWIDLYSGNFTVPYEIT